MSSTAPIEPIGSNLLVTRSATDTVTPGGIVLPEASQRLPHEGTVLAVGEGRRLADGTVSPLTIQVGDKIIFGRHAGNEVEFRGKQYLIMDESAVLARIPA